MRTFLNNTVTRKITLPIRVLRQKRIYIKANEKGKTVGDRHILVIESDDWGSIRVPDKSVYDALNGQGAKLDRNYFTSNDTLESYDDILALLNMLKHHGDKNGKHPVITAFFTMRNADFNKIASNGMVTFFDESFITTSRNYAGNDHAIQLIRQAVTGGLFCPQLHCLNHLNTAAWMKDLRSKRQDTIMAFNNGMYGVGTNFEPHNPFGYMDAFHNRSEAELNSFQGILADAVSDFIEVFGHRPLAFTAPCYVWDPILEEYLHELGIKYISGANYQLIPQSGNWDELEKVKHPVGSQNKFGMTYLNRNADLELIYGQEETISNAFRQVSAAFEQKKPAVVSIHRANFVDAINGKRDIHIKQFSDFIEKIQRKWPDVEFMSTIELGDVISGANG